MPTVIDSKVESRRLVLPAEANAIETAHGGNILKWMERTGSMSAMHFCGGDVVTVGFDRGRFRESIPQGDIALIDAYVYEVGDSSMTVRVRCFHEKHDTGERQPIAEAKLVSVAVDDEGESITVPELTVDSDPGRRLREEARNADDI